MYKIFETETDAMQYSHSEAVQAGHNKPNDHILYLYGHRETIGNKWAVLCPEGTEPEPEWKETE